MSLLKQFKNFVPVCGAYISKQKVETTVEVAALADDCVLMHRGSFGTETVLLPVRGVEPSSCYGRPFSGEGRGGGNLGDSKKVCNFYHKCGHWKPTVTC